MDNPVAQFEDACAKRGVSVRQVLGEAKVAPSTYWRWREGLFEPRPKTMRKLNEVLERLPASSAPQDRAA
jgi:transcriptional regulator with XRE-family HTH domain